MWSYQKTSWECQEASAPAFHIANRNADTMQQLLLKLCFHTQSPPSDKLCRKECVVSSQRLMDRQRLWSMEIKSAEGKVRRPCPLRWEIQKRICNACFRVLIVNGHNKGIATIIKKASEPRFDLLLAPLWLEEDTLEIQREMIWNDRDFVEKGKGTGFVDLWRIFCQRKLEWMWTRKQTILSRQSFTSKKSLFVENCETWMEKGETHDYLFIGCIV